MPLREVDSGGALRAGGDADGPGIVARGGVGEWGCAVIRGRELGWDITVSCRARELCLCGVGNSQTIYEYPLTLIKSVL